MEMSPIPKTRGGTTLRASPPLRRLVGSLEDLIIVGLEAYTRTHGNSYSLVTLHYVSGENNDGRCCMRFDGQVKDLEANANIPLSLEFAVKIGDELCYQHS